MSGTARDARAGTDIAYREFNSGGLIGSGARASRAARIGRFPTRLRAPERSMVAPAAAYFTVSLLCPNSTRRDSASETAGAVLIFFASS